MIKRRPYFNPNPYFNKDEFNNAIMNIGCDPYGAKDRLESYLKSYPQDGSAYGYYASLLIRLGYFSSAEQIVNKLEQLLATAKPSYRSLEKDKLRLIEAKVKLLSYQKKYEELYAYCCEHSLELTKTRPNLRTAKFWCEKQLGLIELDKKDSYSYEYSQIANYSEEDFLSHMREIRLHSDIYQHIPSDKQSATFSPSFPFNEILSEVKQSFLPQNKLYSTDGFTDMYFLDTQNVAYIKDSYKIISELLLCLEQKTFLICIHSKEQKNYHMLI